MSMQGVERVGDMDIAQDLTFQRRTWVVQRCGWAAMVVVTCAALLGYAGEGPSSDGVARSSDGAYEVVYQRYTRHRAPEAVRVVIAEGAVRGDEARVSFDRRYFDGVEVDSVVPEPDSVEVGGGSVVYVFELGEDAAPATILFSVLYDDIGRKRARVALDGHPPVSFSQFIYP